MSRHTDRLEIISIDKLIPYANNARTHSDEQIKKIQASLREFGFVNPVLIDKDCGIIAGHARVEAAKREGLTEVPCVWVEHLTEAQKKAYILADNRLAEDAGWDFELLSVELEELKELDFDIGLTGFGADELSDIFGEEELEAVEDDYEVELPEEPKTKLGDIYQLGRHRLMCGDSTDRATVDRLMDGAKADMVFTDPPYGMHLDTDYSEIKGSKNAKIQGKGGRKYEPVIGDNDDFSPELIEAIFSNFGYCGEIFIWGADYFAELIPNRNDGSWVAWDKRGSEDADKIIGNCFELCWSKAKHKKEIARVKWMGAFGSADARERVHPTQKPLKLCEWFFNKYGGEGEVVADLFGGSGSTLIACEQLNRTCYMMELDPKYCDVIIDRWSALTGLEAQLL